MTQWIALAGVLGLGIGAGIWAIRRRSLDRWLPGYVADYQRRRLVRADDNVHLLLCIADHFEPKWGHADAATADERIQGWARDYPKLFGNFRDHDGRPPRHTFFYPEEEYEPRYIDTLAQLCVAGFAEVEIHLHHDNDTAQGLREKLLAFKHLLAERHGLLGRNRETSEIAYAFVHGNWALNNSRPDGRWCGVNDEITVLADTGCYADFTLPSAPSPTQTRTVNRIYYARSDPARPKGHNRGVNIGAGLAPAGSLMLIQGPLMLDWGRRKWGLVPRIENACLQPSQPPSMARLDTWLKAKIQVPARADWFFVKLHTHGATESNQKIVLGEPMVRFHQELSMRAAKDSRFHYHYVTAREMFNLACAAENGWTGSVDDARDYEIAPSDSMAMGRARLIRS